LFKGDMMRGNKPPLKREVARSAGGISAQSTFRKNSFHAQPNQTQQGSHAPANGVWLLFCIPDRESA
ncbi:hypothetical protein, partial [Ruminococcus sp.]|uniref:hypothetical protein n=1 Tax=Ruminococcus sp. TaxID=41978 RepID=UPI00399651AD